MKIYTIMKSLYLIIFILSLSGCVAYAPPIPENYSLPESSKVALHVVASKYPKHTYYGTTVFNNFIKEYEYDWKMKSTIENIFTDAIENSTNLEVVKLENLGIDSDDKINLVTIQNEEWSYLEESSELRKNLSSQNVSVVISIVEKPMLALLSCSNLGCAEFESEGYGLFSKSFLFISRHSSAVSFDISIEVINPPIDLYRSVEFADIRDFETRNKPLSEFTPKDHKNLTEADMALAKDGIIQYFDELAKITVEHLKN